ncbi:hypothetical protein AURDEDRAFT_123262 [Auricularia subglabra TFB-10046 SS5]|nr:hypothetical protein AURDEDRAFT_123262 [Auricularia subglabra TFB-10046 SS5]
MFIALSTFFGTVLVGTEYPQLKRSHDVKHIFEILVHKLSEDPQRQIWPEVKGCDGVFLIDRTITCPAGAKLYYGSVKKPIVTAQTTPEKDATVKVAASGIFPSVTRECMEILSGEFVSEVFTKSGVCEAATSKGDNGKVMTRVKQILESTKNRNYLQQQRIFKTAAKVVGKPLIGALMSSILDSLVAIDYYQKTEADTAALTKQIDDMVKATTGTSPGLAAAWNTKTEQMEPTKAALTAELKKQIAQKVKQAKETAQRNEDCDKPASPLASKPPSRRAIRGLTPITEPPAAPAWQGGAPKEAYHASEAASQGA